MDTLMQSIDERTRLAGANRLESDPGPRGHREEACASPLLALSTRQANGLPLRSPTIVTLPVGAAAASPLIMSRTKTAPFGSARLVLPAIAD